MNDLPTYLATLLAEQRLPDSQLSAGGKKHLMPLFAAGILNREMSGRGEVVVVLNLPIFKDWVERHFPASAGRWASGDDTQRARAILQRRDSKATRRGVARSVVHLRVVGDSAVNVLVDEVALPVGRLTADYGLAATLIHDSSRFEFGGQTALIENLEFFLNAESVIPEAPILLNSAGRISDRLIASLARSDFGPNSLLHLPDYDPVGLGDYLRLRAALGSRVVLFRPVDLAHRFTLFGNPELLTRKRRNRDLLEQLKTTDWPCTASAEVFRLICETGRGLEQEAFFLKRNPS